MNKKILITALAFLSISTLVFGQNSRVLSLGGLTYSISDSDYSLNLYDFGKNPAWLINDEQTTFLKVMPSFNRTWGDYKRMYDYGSSDIYGITFNGVKTLGKSGTFLGYTSYNYEQRNDVYRTIKHDTYSGEAFYLADTTTGNFRYNGPKVGFSYSFELLPDLFAGASLEYGVMDGLKNIYTSAKAIIRDVDGKVGLAYRLSDDFVIGSSFFMFDDQEALEMLSVEGVDVEVYNFRGETYSTLVRKPTLNQKIRKKGKGFDGQLYFSPVKNLEVAFKGEYDLAGTYVYLPNTGYKEFEEGYASFENYSFDLMARYWVFDNLQIGFKAGYLSTYSWSKNSERNLLLWEWKLNGPTAGVGGSYYIPSAHLMVGAEFELSSIKADSSKYIDSKFIKLTSGSNLMRVGAEFEAMTGTFIRAGYNYGNDEYDYLYGGKDVKTSFATFGFGYKISDLINLDLSVQYGNLSPKNYNNIRRDKFNMLATVKILSF